MPLTHFHPLVRRWFEERFQAPTEPQLLGWPAIARRRDTLIAAPTGSGKTLAAFLFSLDRLLRMALEGTLRNRTHVVYVSPLRALSNDIQRNLEAPLAELLSMARREHPDCPEIRALVRTGDTPANERQKMVRKPPHILVTTPESLYLVLTGQRSREMLREVETVIVDEIHALARDKRGSHLALSLERLDALCEHRPMRIGLSATQKPMDEIALFLTGVREHAEPTEVIDTGHARQLDLAVEIPRTPLQAVCSHEQWAEVYERIVELIRQHRSTLVFVNTRRMAERVAMQLTERLGEDAVSSHHGSLAHRLRHGTEQRLKQGTLKAVVATASLELGIDVGHIDLVCQVGTPRSISTLLQRIGRAGHSLGVVPKGRLFALTRDELIECLALVRAVGAGRLDRIVIPTAPLDILAQQIVAAVACDDWNEDELFALVRRAYSFRDLSRDDFEEVLDMLSEGFTRRGRRDSYLLRDRVFRRLKARRGARITAVTCGGAIPETADYRVVTDEEERTIVGTVNEDFAIESMTGDIFLLGNTSWQIRSVRGGEVVVRDAQGAPPTIPFWLGEAPGRTAELSAEVAQLREELAERACDAASAASWIQEVGHVGPEGAAQAVAYVDAQRAATNMIPTCQRVLFERFFDESGGMQLVIHAPLGTRINRAWGLALRKRFCRSFNFELQAAAGDNGIVLSLGPQHSFPLEQMFQLVPSKIAREILVQALLAVPFFTSRWRWNATRALAVRRADGGRRVPPPLQRFRADDLLSAIFPASTACLENIVGDIEAPDHPLVRQTIDDCLTEATDFEGLLRVLHGIEDGSIETIGLDTREPSPFSHELLNSNVYTFLDDAPLEERRARAINLRRALPVDMLRDLGKLDPEAVAQVRAEAWPLVRDADELHDALLSLCVLREDEGSAWRSLFDELVSMGRATTIYRENAVPLWSATERWPLVHAVWTDARAMPEVAVPDGVRRDWDREEAVLELIRGRIDCAGPVSVCWLAERLGVPAGEVERALLVLESQGSVLRGKFGSGETTTTARSQGDDQEWCDRRLLARIHRLTLDGLRRQIEPVAPEQFLRFLHHHQHVDVHSRMHSQAGLLEVIGRLEGFEAPAGDWEKFLLPSRLDAYDPAWLDMLTLSGQVVWGRLRPSPRAEDRARPMKFLTRNIPLTLMRREDLPWLLAPEPAPVEGTAPWFPGIAPPPESLGGNARAAYEALCRYGAVFAGQLAALLNLVPSQVQDSLGELAAAGLVTCDGFAGLRSLIASSNPRRNVVSWRRRWVPRSSSSMEGGRWSLLRGSLLALPTSATDGKDKVDARMENWCRLLLRRYGVMFRDLLDREPAAPSWHELVRVYRRMETRGDIRGGRFVAGTAGEQYALPDVVARLRRTEEDSSNGQARILAATDPLNLYGRVGPGPKVPALPGNRVVVRQGCMIAWQVGGESFFNGTPMSVEERDRIERGMNRERIGMEGQGSG